MADPVEFIVKKLPYDLSSHGGLALVGRLFKRINLPDDSTILGSVFERMRAERTRVANQLRAEGTESAEEIRSSVRAFAEREQGRRRSVTQDSVESGDVELF